MKQKYRILASAFLFLLLTTYYLLHSPKATAQTPTCIPLFGGGQTCQTHPDLAVNKQVQDPITGQFIENLTTVSNYLASDQTITFRITITNTSNKSLSDISLTDVLPASLSFKSGNAKYDAKTRTVSDTISKLEKNQTKIYTLNTSVNTANLEASSACAVNQATAGQNNKSGSDYLTFCINISETDVKSEATRNSKGGLLATLPQTTKGGLPIYNQKTQRKTPDTGPEMLALLGLPALAGAGVYFRKKTLLSN